MGYLIHQSQLNEWLQTIRKDFDIYAPKLFEGEGMYSDTDVIRYGIISDVSEIVFDRKSDYSFKEILTPISQTLFYFTEDQVKEATPPEKGAVIFMHSCDIHALKRLDEMYLNNGPADYYYERLRKNIKIVLIGCNESFDNCFCVSMGTNSSDTYDMALNKENDVFNIDCRDDHWNSIFNSLETTESTFVLDYVKTNNIAISIPENLDISVVSSNIWNEYDNRCIKCGRCNFACPTCTCFTMQDIFYTDNGKVGERRRVQASCMIDGFTDVAGGGSYRKNNGERMRFKVMHKVYDYKQRNGYHMCVGCGRCDDICPEYISFSTCVNRLNDAVKEVSENGK